MVAQDGHPLQSEGRTPGDEDSSGVDGDHSEVTDWSYNMGIIYNMGSVHTWFKHKENNWVTFHYRKWRCKESYTSDDGSIVIS